MKRTVRSFALVGTFITAACAAPVADPGVTLAPDLGKRLVAPNAIVSSAHPAASEAGVEVMRRGGNAVDAAVATAFTVAVGEPQMSGIGGGGSMLIWLEDEQRAEYLDFYAAQRPDSWSGLSPDDPGRTDLRVVGIPGEVAGLLEAHERFGRLSRAEVMAPAIRLAEEGFPVNQILAQMIAGDSAKLNRYPESQRIFWPGGRPLQAGDVLRQPALATTLRRIAEEGRSAFYEGEVALTIVGELNEGGHPATVADLAAYEPQWKRPVCGEYRGRVVLSAAPPQTGLQVVHTLNLLEPFDLPGLGLPNQSARAFDVLTSALRVGMSVPRFAEDPEWSDEPAAGVVTPAFASSRQPLVGTGEVVERIPPGDPAPFVSEALPAMCEQVGAYSGSRAVTHSSGVFAALAAADAEGGETTHLSVVDADGNAVALTQTNSSVFGVGARSAAGFMYNDSGIDFARDTVRAAAAEARTRNGSPYWIRRSTISPTIVLGDDGVQMVIGAPGGGRIVTEILQNMVYVLDYGLDPLEALRMPRIYPSATSRTVQLENGFPASLLAEIRQMGYEAAPESFGYARLYMISRQPGGWVGAADPRHNGEVRGY